MAMREAEGGLVERIPDQAIVVRGGQNRPVDIVRGTATHPSGVTGVSVECAAGLSVRDLAVRRAGGDVIRTTGRSPHHATLTGLMPEETSRLLTPTIANPARGT